MCIGPRSGKSTCKDDRANGTMLLVLDILPPTHPTDRRLCLLLYHSHKIGWYWCCPCGPSGDRYSQTCDSGHLCSNHHYICSKVCTVKLFLGLMCFPIKNMFIKDACHGSTAADSKNNPPMEAAGFAARVIILSHPSQVSAGYTPVQNCTQFPIACKFAEPKEKIDCCSGRNVKDDPEFLKSVDAAIVDIVLGRPMYVESFTDYPPWSHLALCDIK